MPGRQQKQDEHRAKYHAKWRCGHLMRNLGFRIGNGIHFWQVMQWYWGHEVDQYQTYFQGVRRSKRGYRWHEGWREALQATSRPKKGNEIEDYSTSGLVWGQEISSKEMAQARRSSPETLWRCRLQGGEESNSQGKSGCHDRGVASEKPPTEE